MIEFEIAENNRKWCSLCHRKIKKGMKYISLYYRSYYGRGYKRICALCIWRLAKKLKEEEIEEWMCEFIDDKRKLSRFKWTSNFTLKQGGKGF